MTWRGPHGFLVCDLAHPLGTANSLRNEIRSHQGTCRAAPARHMRTQVHTLVNNPRSEPFLHRQTARYRAERYGAEYAAAAATRSRRADCRGFAVTRP